MAVTAQEMVKAQTWLEEEVVWVRGADPEYPFMAELGGKKCVIRLNDFPEENLYTLLVNGEEVAQFDDWPKPWVRT